MTKHFITSDIHFSHLKILEYNADTRGHFRNTDEMNEEIIRRWNSVVGVDDHTFILGDVSMGDVSKAPPLIARLNGTKTLIKGNHDRSLMKIPRIEELFAGGIHDYLVYSLDKHRHIVMFHFPIASWDGMNPDIKKSSYMLHGHLHSSSENRHRFPGKIMDIGMDGNNLYPYAIEEALKLCEENASKSPPTSRHSNNP